MSTAHPIPYAAPTCVRPTRLVAPRRGRGRLSSRSPPAATTTTAGSCSRRPATQRAAMTTTRRPRRPPCARRPWRCGSASRRRRRRRRRAGFTLTAPWADGGAIDARFTCDGEDVSPPLCWTAPPAGTVEMALVVTDDDADGSCTGPWPGSPRRPAAVGEGGADRRGVEGTTTSASSAGAALPAGRVPTRTASCCTPFPAGRGRRRVHASRGSRRLHRDVPRSVSRAEMHRHLRPDRQ